MSNESEAKINHIVEAVDHLEETVDKLAMLVVKGFENSDKEFVKVHQEIDEVKANLHSTRLNTASDVELNMLKDRVKHLEDFLGRKPAMA